MTNSPVQSPTFPTESPGSAQATPTAPAQAAVLTAPGTVAVQAVPVPQPGPGQVRVRLEGCGVCASSIPVFEGRDWFQYPQAPGVPGHEGWGVVDALGAGVAQWQLGQRVAVLSQAAFATHDLAPADQLVALPPELDGQPVPGEALGCAMNIFARSGVQPGQDVAIVGIGFLGALLTQLCVAAGARVLAVSRRAFSLDVARGSGAEVSIPMDDHHAVIERVRAHTDGRFCPVVIECVGAEWPLQLASELTAERGRLVIAGYHQDGMRQVNVQLWNWRGIDVVNAHERDPRQYVAGMKAAVAAVAAGRLRPQMLYTHHYPLHNLQQAFTDLRNRPNGFLKALIRTA